MPYMIAPGARLKVGPRGKLYETLGGTLDTLRNMSAQSIQQTAIQAQQSGLAAFAAAYGSDPNYPYYLAVYQAALAKNVPMSFAEIVAAAKKALAAGQPASAAVSTSSASPGVRGAPSGTAAKVILLGAAAAAGLGALYLLRRRRS